MTATSLDLSQIRTDALSAASTFRSLIGLGTSATLNAGSANGVATLGADSKLTAAQIPDISLISYLGSVASQAAMLALTGQQGDWCVRSDLSTTWVMTGSDPTLLANWTQLSYPSVPVQSVFGRTGAVVGVSTDYSSVGITNTPIGASNPSTGAFTSLSSTADGYFNSVRVGCGNNNIATNTAVGASCLTSITAGAFATAIGNLALSSLTTGNHNSAFGYSSNRYCTTASNNTSFGSNSLSLNVTGSNNTAIGSTALQLSTAGNNTAIGAGALASNTTGTNNVGVGTSSGKTNSTGSFNVNIGHATLFSSDGGSNNIAIGYTAGSYETSANKKLYIDSINRMTLEGGIAGSLIYGTFDATPANQTLHLNASTYWHNLYTNSVDWERLAIKWSSNVAIIATEAGGTGTVRNLAITGGNVGIGTTSPSAKLDVAGGTVTTSTPVLNVTQTWNASLVPFTGILANVTDTASASGSLLLDLQVGGSSKFKVGKGGGITATTATLSATLDLTIRTVTYGATMAIDAALGNKIAITLTGNGTVSNPTNAVDGRVLVFRLRQDGSGNRVPVWDTKYSFVGDLATVTLSTGANKIDRVAFEYDSTDDKWYCISFIKGS